MTLHSSVERDAKKFLEGSEGCHGWGHTERVRALCKRIGREEGADLEVLELAALLHDIGRRFEAESGGRICHAEKSAELAKTILEKYGIEREEIDAVVHCVECHRFRGNRMPGSKEARILFEADKLDSIGAIGIGRAFLFCGEHGGRFHSPFREFEVKMGKIKDLMQTATGKRMAKERHAFMEAFFERLKKEMDGEL